MNTSTLAQRQSLAKHHQTAGEHLEKAANSHLAAAKLHGYGEHQAAEQHAKKASDHVIQANQHIVQAAKISQQDITS